MPDVVITAATQVLAHVPGFARHGSKPRRELPKNAELAERFGDDTAKGLEQAIAAGALTPVGDDRYEARVPSLLDAAEGVLAQGVPLDHALAVMAKMRDRCQSVAREFVRLFMEDVWKPFESAGYPTERWPEVRAALDQLRPISSQALMGVYQITMRGKG